MGNGLMSQAIANVRLAQGQLAAISGLPGGAPAVQASIASTLATLIPPVETAASAVLSFARQAAQPLDAASAAIGAGDATALKTALDSFQSAITPVMSAVKAATNGVQASSAVLAADDQTLAAIGSSLQAQITDANTQADAASAQADSLDQSKYYWLALGPFGLVGLAICIAEITEASNNVNSLRQRVSELRAQSSQWSQMQANLSLLEHDIPNLANTLSSLRNALDFLSSDATEVVSDVGAAGAGSPIARAFILTAQQQLATLRTDAS
jgi:DNA repair ATPase RecN